MKYRLIYAFKKEIKRKIVQALRFYYFDIGLVNYLMGCHSLNRGTDDYGHTFEHYVMQKLIYVLDFLKMLWGGEIF